MQRWKSCAKWKVDDGEIRADARIAREYWNLSRSAECYQS
jgi:hypothetical protein